MNARTEGVNAEDLVRNAIIVIRADCGEFGVREFWKRLRAARTNEAEKDFVMTVLDITSDILGLAPPGSTDEETR